MRGWHCVGVPHDVRRDLFDGGQRWCPILLTFPFFVFTYLPIKLEIARSEMYHYRICVHWGTRLEGVGDLSATDSGLWGNKACMRSCSPPLNGVSMSLGPCVACRLSEVVDLAWPSCIISLLNHVECVSGWHTSSNFIPVPLFSLLISNISAPPCTANYRCECIFLCLKLQCNKLATRVFSSHSPSSCRDTFQPWLDTAQAKTGEWMDTTHSITTFHIIINTGISQFKMFCTLFPHATKGCCVHCFLVYTSSLTTESQMERKRKFCTISIK